MQDAYTDVGGRVMQEAIFDYRTSCTSPLLRSRYGLLSSRDTNTVLYVVLAPAARPPWMAEVSKMQEQFSATVHPCTSPLLRIHAPVAYSTSLYIKKGKVNFPPQT